jgi:hypothetical protein
MGKYVNKNFSCFQPVRLKTAMALHVTNMLRVDLRRSAGRCGSLRCAVDPSLNPQHIAGGEYSGLVTFFADKPPPLNTIAQTPDERPVEALVLILADGRWILYMTPN